MSNNAKGRKSFDATSGNVLVEFINRNISEYPTEVSGPKFDLVPVKKQKDLMINAARMHAQQEYDRIMELVAVLQSQASQIKERLDLTDMVHAAELDFQLYPGQVYWLVHDENQQSTRLTQTGPQDWSTGAPKHYRYICRIKWLGDYTWIRTEDE